MFKQYIKRLTSVSPRIAIVGALVIVLAVSGIALLLTRGGSEANADPAIQPRAARLERVDGSVGIARAEDKDRQVDWSEATVNTPVTVGDRIYARDGASASIALTGHDFVRLNQATALDVLALEERKTQFALRGGSALFDLGVLAPDQLFEVATPCGAVDFKEPGLYQVGLDGSNAVISVLSGLAQVVGLGGTGSINKGQVFTLTGATANAALASTLSPYLAGDIIDDYYHYRYPRVYDDRYRSYDAYLAEPRYYDPYRTSLSYQYLPADIPGLYDLDSYGDWVNLNDYGYCWAPRVTGGWAPFRSGFWDLDDWWGPSWVSSEPWGWAPYHYGRWALVDQRWFWVPVEVRTRAIYCPAPVAFVPLADQIAWVPLGPGEVYVPRYYDVNFRPRYLASQDVINTVNGQRTFINFNAPGAVTVVPVRAFGHEIGPGVFTTGDARLVAKSRAVLDPFSVDGVRQLAIRREDARRKFKFERGEQDVFNKTVVASTPPAIAAVRGNIAKALKVEAVPEQRKENKLKINDTAQVTGSSRRDGLPQPLAQSQRMSELATRAEQGDKSARREMRQLMREEQRAADRQSANQPAQPPTKKQQAQQEEQLRQQTKQQRKAERQQQGAAPSEQQDAARQAQQQQIKQQRKVEHQQQQQQAAGAAQQQQAARRAQREQLRQQQHRQQQVRQQRMEQSPPTQKPPEASLQRQVRQAERSQRAQQEATRQAQMGRQQEQWKAVRRADQQRQATQQQQTARAQAAQRQAIQQQATRAQAAQRQMIGQQQAAREQAQRQAMIQQQAARAQSAQRQAPGPPTHHAPALLGPPARQDPGAQSRNPERAQRKPPAIKPLRGLKRWVCQSGGAKLAPYAFFAFPASAL